MSTELRLADQEGILDRLNTDILNTLVPEAIKVYMDKLVNEKDAFVAKDVLKHLDRLTARADEKKKGDQPRYSIEAYIQAQAGNILGTDGTIDVKQVIQGQRAKQILEEARVSPHDEQSRLDILDGVVVE